MGWKIYTGDALEILKTMDDRSFNCCVTSPPYFGLRDYGHEKQIGLEETPKKYVLKLLEVFRDVRRVLRDDGTLWIVLGDRFGNTKTGRSKKQTGLKSKDLIGIPWRVAFALQHDGWYLRSDIIEEVELYCPCGCGFILEERIWRYSQDRDIIWSKPNPMPESVKDRPTRSHEYIFLLAKSKKYYYDRSSILEKSTHSESLQGYRKRRPYSITDHDPGYDGHRTAVGLYNREEGKKYPFRNRRSVWTIAKGNYPKAHFASFPPKLIEPCILAGCPKGGTVLDPFVGVGTTGLVALRNGRNFVGIELNSEYVELAKKRIKEDAPLFN